MKLHARFPRFTAWLAVAALIGATTIAAVAALHTLGSSTPLQLHHAHGVITAIQGNDEFALEMPGHPEVEWFRVAPGARISMAHLCRHLRERAATDVTYQVAPGPAMPLAWAAD
jgi:hypothetical protein